MCRFQPLRFELGKNKTIDRIPDKSFVFDDWRRGLPNRLKGPERPLLSTDHVLRGRRFRLAFRRYVRPYRPGLDPLGNVGDLLLLQFAAGWHLETFVGPANRLDQ